MFTPVMPPEPADINNKPLSDTVPLATAYTVPIADEKNFWEHFDLWHAILQYLRALMRFCTLGHDSFIPWEGPYLLDGDATSIAFTILSLIYVPFLLTILGKVLFNLINGKEALHGLPKRTIHSITEAVIWSVVNIPSAIFALVDHSKNIYAVDTLLFFMLAIAITLDAWNTYTEQTKAMNQLTEDLKKYPADSDDETIRITRRSLEREFFVLARKRESTLIFGIVGTVAGLCLSVSNGLSYVGTFPSLAGAFSTVGFFLLSTAAFFLVTYRMGVELYAHNKEYQKTSDRIQKLHDEICGLALNATTEGQEAIQQHQAKIKLLQARQVEIKNAALDTTLFYSGLLVIISTSLFAGPVAGLIAFATFYVAWQLYTHTPQIKQGYVSTVEYFKSHSKSVRTITQPIKSCLEEKPASTGAPQPEIDNDEPSPPKSIEQSFAYN